MPNRLGAPRALYFTVFCLTIVATRPFIGRYADRAGHARIIVPCLVMIVLGCGCWPWPAARRCSSSRRCSLGLGFGSAYPLFVAHLMHHVAEHRRGATFGAIIGAFDTGIGTGSIAVGWISGRYGFGRAFGIAGAIALLSILYFRTWRSGSGLRPSRHDRAEGLAALPRHHDLRHAGVAAVGARRGGQPAVHPARARARHQLLRHRRHVFARRQRGGRRPRPEGLRQARRGRDRHQGLLPGRRARQQPRPVAQAHHVGHRRSLRRLGLDYVDLYQIHRFDPTRRSRKRSRRCTTS